MKINIGQITITEVPGAPSIVIEDGKVRVDVKYSYEPRQLQELIEALQAALTHVQAGAAQAANVAQPPSVSMVRIFGDGAAEPDDVTIVHDKDGDPWDKQNDGTWRLNRVTGESAYSGYAWQRLLDAFGPLAEVPV